MAKIERKYLAHYINATPGTPEAPTYERLGRDLEEYNIEMGAQVETKKNILGEASTNISAYEKTASAEPYFADQDDKLFTWLQSIIVGNLALDAVKTDVVEVHMWGDPSPENTYEAYKETVFIEITSYGGDTTGYQIPFTVHYVGDRVKGTFNVETKTFTAA